MNGWKEAYRGIIDDNSLDSMDRNRKIIKMEGNYKNGSFIVATFNNEIVGFCRYVDDDSFSKGWDIDCEIVALYIKPELKYQGIGTKLFNYVVDEMKSKNKKKLIIWCLKDNYPSRKFYEKMGGVIIGEKDFVKDNKAYPEVGFLYNLESR